MGRVKRLAAWLVLMIGAAMISPAAGQAETREVPVTYQGREIELAGLLLLPERGESLPAAVIVQGSGESDRSNLWARAVADRLVNAGLAVLITDKRGSGLSGGDWRTAGFDELADDAIAGVRFLAGRDEVDSGRIGLVGLSQGGRVVPVAAARSTEVAFVINLVGDAVSFAEQSAHEMSNIARQAGLSDEHRNQVLELNGSAGQALLTGDWTRYARLREAGIRSPWSRIAQAFPPVGDPVWAFFGKVFGFDPMPYWILLRQPALIVYGEEDELDNVAVEESVRRLTFGFRQAGKTNYQISVIPGVGHDLGLRSDREGGSAATDAIEGWLKSNVLVAE